MIGKPNIVDQSAAGHVPSQPQLSLPKGGGAIRGIGEKFAANPVTGSGSMSIPIAVSPGRAGFGPALSLSYDSGSGNGPFGFGWSLALPAITRKTDKGIPRYGDGAEPDVFVLSGAEDLVPESGGRSGDLQPHRETRAAFGATTTCGGIARASRGSSLASSIGRTPSDPSDTFWRSISRDNVTTWYGRTPESRISDPADPRRIVQLADLRDPRRQGQRRELRLQGGGLARRRSRRNCTNATAPTRRAAPTATSSACATATACRTFPTWPSRRARRCPPTGASRSCSTTASTIRTTRIRCTSRSHGPAATTRSRATAPGFEVRTYRLCQRVLMFHHFADEPEVGANCLVRSTDFEYSFEADPDDARNPIYSFLLAATHAGYRRRRRRLSVEARCRPLEFEYSQPIVDEQVRDVDPESLRNLPAWGGRLAATAGSTSTARACPAS